MGSDPMARVRRPVARLLELSRSPSLMRIVANSGWMMGEQLLKVFGGLFVGILIARHLGAEYYGQLNFAMAFSGLFAIVGTLGLNRIGVREMVAAREDPKTCDIIVNTMFFMRVLVSLGLSAIVVGSAWLLHQGNLRVMLIVAPMVIFSSFDVIELWFQSQTRARVTSSARSLSYLAVTVLRIVLLWLGAPVEYFALAYLLEIVGAAVALHTVFRRVDHRFVFGLFRPALARTLILESWTEIIAGFSAVLFVRLDQVMLGNMVGDKVVGIFAVASRLSESWYFVPSALVASTFPAIVRARESDPDQFIKRIGHLMRVLALISYAAIAATTLLAPWFINKMYGPTFQQSATILTIHIWCGLFMSLGIASGSWIMAEKRVRLSLYRNLSGAVANVILNLVLIPRYGAIGASFATLSSLIVAFFLFDMFVPSMHAVSRAKWRALFLLG